MTKHKKKLVIAWLNKLETIFKYSLRNLRLQSYELKDYAVYVVSMLMTPFHIAFHIVAPKVVDIFSVRSFFFTAKM
jgi:hypothetical protein